MYRNTRPRASALFIASNCNCSLWCSVSAGAVVHFDLEIATVDLQVENYCGYQHRSLRLPAVRPAAERVASTLPAEASSVAASRRRGRSGATGRGGAACRERSTAGVSPAPARCLLCRGGCGCACRASPLPCGRCSPDGWHRAKDKGTGKCRGGAIRAARSAFGKRLAGTRLTTSVSMIRRARLPGGSPRGKPVKSRCVSTVGLRVQNAHKGGRTHNRARPTLRAS